MGRAVIILLLLACCSGRGLGRSCLLPGHIRAPLPLLRLAGGSDDARQGGGMVEGDDAVSAGPAGGDDLYGIIPRGDDDAGYIDDEKESRGRSESKERGERRYDDRGDRWESDRRGGGRYDDRRDDYPPNWDRPPMYRGSERGYDRRYDDDRRYGGLREGENARDGRWRARDGYDDRDNRFDDRRDYRRDFEFDRGGRRYSPGPPSRRDDWEGGYSERDVPRDGRYYDSSRGGRSSLLVKGLSKRTRPRELYRVFERFGRVRDVYMPRDYHSRVPKGFAFVEFVDFVCAKDALRSVDGTRIEGNVVSVLLAQHTRKAPDEMMKRTSRRGGREGRFDQDWRGARDELAREGGEGRRTEMAMDDMQGGGERGDGGATPVAAAVAPAQNGVPPPPEDKQVQNNDDTCHDDGELAGDKPGGRGNVEGVDAGGDGL